MNSRHTYSFNTGDGKNKALLGGKGANLCEMTQMGLNVPPGFVISTETCLSYLQQNSLPAGLMDEVRRQIAGIEELTGRQFGGNSDPLLVSVRSGAAISMPGMMATILNLGLNKQTLAGLIEMTDDPRFAYDAYRRFIQMFGKVALGIDDEKFDVHFNTVKRNAGIKADVALSSDQLQEISELFLKVVHEETARPFPEDVYDQLELAIKAVFLSWQSHKAVAYRRAFNITPKIANGTAVNIVTMVFGNMGDDCATGVGFTRNPGTGENEIYGEYLVNAQGEDVVAGIRTPKPVQEMRSEMPEQYRQLQNLRHKLEAYYREIQDFEFTIERGVLYCLQTRNGKMNAAAMVKTSIDMVAEELIDKPRALLRINPESLEQLLHPQLGLHHNRQPLAQGLPASPGAASGKCVFDADTAVRLAKTGADIILLREETKPEDIHGFFAAQGILTSRGGKTSHAAVVARGMGKACVAGAEDIHIDVRSRLAIVGDIHIKEGDPITIDGSSGNIYLGRIPTIPSSFSEELKTLLAWADSVARLRIYANVDTPETARLAIGYGAKGIGLCRTERMFNACDRLPLVIDMILANSTDERETALAKLFPIQRDDFQTLFEAMAPHPVTVRLLDPPMHEFLPSEHQLLEELEALRHYLTIVKGRRIAMETFNRPCELPAPFNQLGKEVIMEAIAKKELMLAKVLELYEVNPMLGHRGVRLGMSYPEIYKMQIRSILEAAARCLKQRIQIEPEIMVPQVITAQELKKVKEMVEQIRAEVEDQYRLKLDFKFGTMIETVRACTRADRLAEIAHFFSFGTNDLTQAVFSFSREDAENKFLPLYKESGILEDNPFENLDIRGLGKLMKMAVDLGREQRPDLRIGICGEHGGHPRSIRFCHNLGLDYVSCSAPRIPVARLAAAHAKLLEGQSL
ncbi:MAG: pyruvate, phosphate dikinase [Methylococcales bacterium]|nr:pyruvate, phosphate dikinase [Methylococcales bacterium]